MTQLRYIGPHEAVEVPDLGEQIIEHGEVVDVPAELAGRAPYDYGETNEAGEDVLMHHPGEGLLAQEANWELVSEAPAGDSGEAEPADADGDEAEEV